MKAQTFLVLVLLSGCITQPSETRVPDIGGADAATADSATADLSILDLGTAADSTMGDSGGGDGDDVGVDVGAPDMQGSWWNEEFQERVAIDFPDDIEANVPSFIAHIQLDLSDPMFANLTREEVRFVPEDGGAAFAHEFSEFVPNGIANAWVRLDQLSASKRVWLYFDDVNTPTSTENPGRVWGSNGVVALHFAEQAMVGNSAGDVEFQCTGTCDAAQDGLVGTAFSPGDSGAYLQSMAGVNADLHPGEAQRLTVSVWYKGGSPYRGALLFSESECVGWQVSINENMAASGGDIYTSFAPIAGQPPCDDSPDRYSVRDVAVLDGSYHNITWVVNRTTDEATLYHDGMFAKNVPLPATGGVTNTTPLLVGAETGGLRLFDGELDEVQILSFSRSADAVYAHHRNLTDPNYLTISQVD